MYVAALVVLLAGMVAGMTGFGFALVAVPILMIVMPPRTVVPLIQLLSLGLQFLLLIECRRHLSMTRVWLLVLGSLVGTPAGTLLLLLMNAQTLRAITGIVVILGALALAVGWRWPVQNEKAASLPVGVLSGTLAGSTGLGGPPVVLFFSNQGLEKHSFRANLVLYFACLNVVTVVSSLAAGLFTRQVLLHSVMLLPILVLGTFGGIYLANHVNQDRFRHVVTLVMILTGISAIVFGIGIV
jgi:uncharacterized membrane protein YfcA